MADVLVIEPGHGSTWLHNAQFVDDYVVGEAWDDSGVGSSLMPDDYRGQPVVLSFPRHYVLKERHSNENGETP